MRFALQYGSAVVIFVIADLIWLGVVAKSFYRRELATLIADDFNLWAATAFYLMYPIGVVVFAVSPSLAAGTWVDALLMGGLLGFFAYATYDLTNLATLRGWPLRLSIVDMAWGTFLTASVAAAVHFVV